MIDPKEKNNNQGVKEVVVTRRDILKGFAATTIASLLTLFPELRGVEKANATTFYSCYNGQYYYCCDITVINQNCWPGVCQDVEKVQYVVICEPVFGCTSCGSSCRGPYYICNYGCVVAPACWMCPG
jgi:hypothetical protein